MGDTKNQIEAYKQFATFHGIQETLFWTRNNIMVVLQVGLLAALATVVRDAAPQDRAIAAIIAGGVGLFLAHQWITMVERSRYLFEVGLVALERAEEILFADEVQFRLFTYYRLKASGQKPSATWAPITENDKSRILFLADQNKPRLSKTWIRVGRVFMAVWASAITSALLWIRFR